MTGSRSRGSYHVFNGDVLETLKEIPDGVFRCCVTSPPYWGLRDYGIAGQLGLERTPDEYVERVVAVFAEVRRVLADDGTLWLNLGDSYNGSGAIGGVGKSHTNRGQVARRGNRAGWEGLKPKDLVGIPWRVAFALQADGWYLRSDIIWAKPNPMPESVTDRPTKAHEYLFLMSKSKRYYYDAKVIAEPLAEASVERYGYAFGGAKTEALIEANRNGVGQRTRVLGERETPSSRNRRSVWTIPPKPFKGAHFAVMPEALVEPCILAGSAPGDSVLDPFSGSGTVGVVALRHGRDFIGIDLNKDYVKMSLRRIKDSIRE
jgi:DNA modification methylase